MPRRATSRASDVADTDIAEHTVVRVVDEVVIDLMGRACGLTYADVAADMELHDLGGVMVPIASPAALIRMKDTYRPQDAIDRAFRREVLDRRSRT